MTPAKLENLTIGQTSELLSQRSISSSSLTEERLKDIFDLNPRVNWFITVTDERARSAARRSDERIASSKRLGQLDGIPVAVKDNFFMQGVRCTAGSKILSDFVPSFSAPVVQNLENAGAVILGKTNMHEFASGITNTSSYFGVTRNPWNTERITGGSSGGSAAAVATGLAFAALGTDTAGSIRVPASFCGVVGLKPTYGLVSARGTIPLAASLDHVGVLARSCLDAAIVLQLIAGYDEQDPTSVADPKQRNHMYREETLRASNSHNLRIGIPRKYFLELVDGEVLATFETAVRDLHSLGFELHETEIPNIDNVREIWEPIRFSEASAYHDSWLKTRAGDYFDDVRKKLERGKDYSAVQYIKAKSEAVKFRAETIKVFEQFDALITPTAPTPAPKIDQTKVSIGSSEVDVYSLLVRQTLPFNVTGLPAVSVPMGFSKEGLPLGLQIVGRPFEEAIVLGIGSTYEQKLGKVGVAPLS